MAAYKLTTTADITVATKLIHTLIYGHEVAM